MSTVSFIDKTGTMWVFNMNKTMRLSIDEGSNAEPDVRQFRPIQTFGRVMPRSILVDHEGHIWMADTDGLHRFSYTPLRQLRLKSQAIFPAIAPSVKGAIYVAVSTPQGLAPIYQTKRSGLELVRGFGDAIQCIYKAPDGSTWFGNSSLWHLRDGKLVQTFRPSRLRPINTYVEEMTADRQGNLWVTFNQGGLYRLSNDSWTRIDESSGLPSRVPVIEYTDDDGYIWFGFTKSRLARFRDGKTDNFGPSDGLDIGIITAIQVSKGDVWVGGELGLVHFDHGRFHRLNAVNPENLRGISGIIRMPNGDLWLNGLSGIVHIQAKELQLSIADNTHRLTGQRFSREDGLFGYAPQIAPLPSAIQSSDGRLWFSTTKGVFWLDPSHAVKPTFKPLVNIRSITADGKRQTVGSPLLLAAGTSNVRIEYDAVNLSEPESVHYRYKLQGNGADWQNADELTFVSYLNLHPGAYTFQVEATDNNGIWSESPTSLTMRILPAFYQTWWFLPLVALVALLCIYSAFRIRIEQNAKQVRVQYATQLMERTRVARELHDTFMQTVQASKLAVDEARKPSTTLAMNRALDLEQLSGWLGQATEEGRAALNSLRAASADECDLPEALRRAIEECKMQRITKSTFAVTGDMRETHPAVRDEIYRIAYEAISNAYAHSKASHLRVRLMYTHDLTISIIDDGIGIDPMVAEKGKDGHFGLQGMRERVAHIKGKLTIASSSQTGTEITVSVPGRIVFREATLNQWTKLQIFLKKLRESSPQD
ncbi:sensor histidine kinase [Acidicapsa ligni]|uniref:sensor histidine kinase n=1 Tax=Acidicapsa ligni TaxID=542300 RepID=UPI0021E0B492|nr:sensor histidine kinase [Acidicapsa ligni]